MKINNFKYLLLASLIFASCSEEVEEETVAAVVPTAGTANFSKFVALGNSITAGYTDGALFKASQANSFAKLLADQFKTVGGGDFKTPFMNDNIGGFAIGGNIIPGNGPRLVFSGGSPKPLNLVIPSAIPTTNPTTVLTGGFNNFGVPGAKVTHLDLAGYGIANPYFGRFATTPTAKIIDDAMAQTPTFFSLWIGNNDVLGYATTGGDGTNPITSTAVFQSAYTGLVNRLTSANAKGVVANIPYVTALPHFTTIVHNQIPGLPAANVTQLNQLFGGINQALAGASLPARFKTLVADDGNPATTERNPILIHDESLPNISSQITAALTPLFGAPTATALGNLFGQARHANDTTSTTVRDLVVLPAGGLLGQPQAGATAPFNINGVSFPLQDKWVLLPTEQAEIKTATDAFNGIIKTAATSKGLAFVDANALMNQISSTGIRFGTFSMNASLVSGGTFSLDGIHLTPRANALAANKFMEAISATYGAKFNMYSPEMFSLNYPTILPN